MVTSGFATPLSNQCAGSFYVIKTPIQIPGGDGDAMRNPTPPPTFT